MNSSPQNQTSFSDTVWNDGASSVQSTDGSHDCQVELELERLHELRRQVAAQEQKLQSLRQQAASTKGSHSLLTAEQSMMKSLIFTKEKELALALMKVAELTSQLEQLRRGHVDDTKSSQKKLEFSNSTATIAFEQQQLGGLQRTIPIKIIREGIHMNHDAKKSATFESAKEKSRSDAEKGVRYIPILVTEKAATLPVSYATDGNVSPGCTNGIAEKTAATSPTGRDKPTFLQKETTNANNFNIFVTDRRSTSLTSDQAIVNKSDRNVIKNNVVEIVHCAPNYENGKESFYVSSKDSSRQEINNINVGKERKISIDMTGTSRDNNKTAEKKADNDRVIDHNIMLKKASEDQYEIQPIHSKQADQEKVIYKVESEKLSDQKVENERVGGERKINIVCENINHEDMPSDKLKFEHRNKADLEDTSKCKKEVANIGYSMFHKKDNGAISNGKKDSLPDRGVSDDKKDNTDARNLSNNKLDESTSMNFSQDKKSFSDFFLSSQLARPIRQLSAGDAVSEKPSESGGYSEVFQSQPAVIQGKTHESGIKSERARFFMSMVNEDESGSGQLRVERTGIKYLGSPVVPSPTTSRGRSSSSAIMSRFAPQPYGRSKSVDSGSLRNQRTSSAPAVNQAVQDTMLNESNEDATLCHPQPPDIVCQSSTVTSNLQSSVSPTTLFSTGALKETTISGMQVHGLSSFSDQGRTVPPLSSDGLISSCKPPQTLTATSSSFSFPEQQIFTQTMVTPQQDTVPLPSPRLSTSKLSLTPTPRLSDEKDRDSKFSTVITAAENAKTETTAVLPAKFQPQPPVNKETTPVTTDRTGALNSAMIGGLCQSKTIDISVGHSVPGDAVSLVKTTISDISSSMSDSSMSDMKLKSKTASTSASSDTKTVFTKSITSLPVITHASTAPSISRPPTANVPLSPRVPITSAEKSSVHESLAGSSKISSAENAMVSSFSDEVQTSEETSDTPWDSNVKRLAHLFAMTIGGTVKGNVSVHGNRNKGTKLASSDFCSAVIPPPPFTNVPERDITLSSSDKAEHSTAEQQASDNLIGCELNVVSSHAEVPEGLSGTVQSTVPDNSKTLGLNVQCQSSGPSHSITSNSESSLGRVDILEHSKIDTSADSVSSALSVLLKSSTSLHSSPVRPSRLRTTISSAYRRKLGSGAMDTYSQNMSLIYGDGVAKQESSTCSNENNSSIDSVTSPPLLEVPMIEDLPRILALDTLDGMPFYPRIGCHLMHHEDSLASDETVANGKTTELPNKSSELLTSGDVELTVITNPVQTADLVRLDTSENNVQPIPSFSPSDELVPSYIDDPVSSDQDRFSSILEMSSRPSGYRLTRKNGKPKRRVTFDCMSLLLSAALEGEKDLVVEMIHKLGNSSQKTETGVSALHNAVCGGHTDIVKYLIDYGCDVNATDSDGWTPLHCAASNNNIELMQILIENGASILPLTISDCETPVQKCSRNLVGCEEAVRYLSDVAKSLGIVNDGWVYVTSNFTNVCSDELVLCDNDRVKILRRGDESESDWWWAKNDNAEGYVPQSLLALYPRLPSKWQK